MDKQRDEKRGAFLPSPPYSQTGTSPEERDAERARLSTAIRSCLAGASMWKQGEYGDGEARASGPAVRVVIRRRQNTVCTEYTCILPTRKESNSETSPDNRQQTMVAEAVVAHPTIGADRNRESLRRRPRVCVVPHKRHSGCAGGICHPRPHQTTMKKT